MKKLRLDDTQIALQATTRIVQAVLRSTDEHSLLQEACRIIVDAGYRFCWTGEAENNQDKTVRPTAWAGHEAGYLSAMKVTWSNSPHGEGPTGTAIRTGKPVMFPDLRREAAFEIWLREAAKRGYRSSCALPLMHGDKPFGALNIVSGRTGAFGKKAMQLLSNLAEVLSFGIVNLRERHRAESVLQRREEQLRQAVRVSQLGVFDHDHLSGKIYASREHQKIYGLEPGEEFTLPLLINRIHPDDREHVSQSIARAHDPAGDGLYEVEFRIVRPDGTLRWLSTRAQTFFSGTGHTRQAVRTIGAVGDITERRLAEETLRQREEQMRQAVQVSRLGVFDHDHLTDSVYCSPETREIFGLGSDEKFSLPLIFSRIHADDLGKTLKVIEAAHAPGGTGTHSLEYRVIRSDQSVRWINVHAQTFFEGEGNAKRAMRTVGAVADITERRQAEELLQKREEQLRQAVEVAKLGIFDHDQTTDAVYVSPELRAIYGFPSDEEITLSLWGNHIHPEDRKAVARAIQLAHGPEGNGVYEMEHRVIRPDGGIRWVMTRSQTFFKGEGSERRPVRTVGAIADVTERRQEQEALRQAEEKFREIFDHAVVGIFQSTPEGRYLSANQEMARMAGYDSPEEMIAGVCDIAAQEFVNPAQRLEFRRLAEQQGVVRDFEYEFVRRDGSHGWSRASARVVRDSQGNVAYYEGTEQDITEQKRLEEQFKQAQKMEAVGRLAGGVAHDFNNLLSVIMGYSDLAGGLIAGGKSVAAADKVAQIRRAAERGASLTRQLLAFSRRQVVHPRILNLNQVVGNSADMLKRLVGEDVAMSFKPGDRLWPVKVDPGQIEQILMNLTVNARDAMPTGGRISMETSNIEADDHFASQHPPMVPGSYVTLSFADTGTGIAPEHLPLIFEPFFTTKETGKGTGLGLATVYGIVKQNHGHIQVYSEPDNGTVFRIYFPRAEGEEILPELGKPAELRRGSETILLVEDEAHLRGLVAALLEEGGYKVLLAENGAAALALVQDHPEPIDLLLTDVIMPGMSGVELCKRMQEARPDLRVLCMSGYTGDHLSPYGQFESDKTFIQKPFTNQELLKKLRAILDS